MNVNRGLPVRTAAIFWRPASSISVGSARASAVDITPTPAPSTTPSPPPTTACSPCSVSAQGNVYDSANSQPLENALVLLEWEDRCWGEQQQEVFTDASGYYETIQLNTHAVGQGRLTASFSGYGMDCYDFTSCGDHPHDFHLDPLPTPDPAGAFFRLTEVESLRVTHPRGSTRYDLAYQLRDTAGEISSRGHIFDTENRFYPNQSGEVSVLLRSFVHQGFTTQSGDNLLVTYDAGRQKRIYLPELTGYTELYVGADGSTYYDSDLLLPAQFALPGTPTPTLTPRGYHSPTTTPQSYITPTPPPSPQPSCMSCPGLVPGSITLSEQTSSREVIYDFTYDCRRNPDQIHNWWTSSTDWLTVDPPQGFGFDSQTFAVTVSLGDTSLLGPGPHADRVFFHDDWGGCSICWLDVQYVGTTPTPSPTASPPVLVLDSGDYDGDGTAEIAVFRPASGLWAMRGLSRFYFGRAGDLPVSGDYRGDGTAGAALYRSSTGLWAIRNLTRIYTGFTASVPVPGDYAGDGTCDIGIYFRGLWSIPGLTRFWFGSAPYIPVPGDYTGDGRTDIAVFRGERNLWAVRGITRIYFGAASDRPVPGDYLGDGLWVPAIFRPATGLWAVRGWTRVYYGRGGDFPVPADFSGAGYDDPAVFRPATGLWAVRGLTRAYFGASGDLPATR
ncbi:MAG: hypothetical protein P9M08_09470 [Candidatus Erginobacter occultus]|nr:hypothetical protein [Candidatus Erginobacter occultus]